MRRQVVAVLVEQLPKGCLVVVPVEDGIGTDERDAGMLVQAGRDLHICALADPVGAVDAHAVGIVVARQEHRNEQANVGRGAEHARF